MNIISLALYNQGGERVVVDFKRGLNIVTGVSGTGKSALLDMVEYCLGRKSLITPVGPITDTVVWYGLLVQLPNQRAFVGRPAPAVGKASSTQAMLEFGSSLQLPNYDGLRINADTATVRSQLGRAIGIDENLAEPTSGFQQAFEANLSHATFLCLQRQSEIGDRELLFHRQGEDGIKGAIQATLPYFLGAMPADTALVRQRLTAARRALRAAELEIRRAEAADEQMEVAVLALVAEARVVGLVTGDEPTGSDEALRYLQSAVATATSDESFDDLEQAGKSSLVRRRDELRRSLRQAGEERAILEGLQSDEALYDGVVGRQAARLRSLELLGPSDSSAEDCPVCGSLLPEADPTVEELRIAASELQDQIGAFSIAQPRRAEALSALNLRVVELREELRAVDGAINSLETTGTLVLSSRQFSERQAFLQGRIQQFLSSSNSSLSTSLRELRQTVKLRQSAVQAIEEQLDPDEEREQLMSRLTAIGRDMTRWADQLGLEHSESSVRLDLKRLTVVADTPSGPAALNRIGSGANWIGYHIVAHLALHAFFTAQNRPVPRFLMLDQPTQAYYPSDVDKETGVPLDDDDRAAVYAMFQLMRTVVDELEGELQVIVCDHANLEADWFQSAVVANWRNGDRLIPASWLGD